MYSVLIDCVKTHNPLKCKIHSRRVSSINASSFSQYITPSTLNCYNSLMAMPISLKSRLNKLLSKNSKNGSHFLFNTCETAFYDSLNNTSPC